MNKLLRWSPVNGRARAGRHIRSLTVGIVLSFLLIVPSQLALAQTAVEGGYKDEDGNMHWGESRPEPQTQSSTRRSYSAPVQRGPSAAEIAARQRDAKVTSLNENGVAALLRARTRTAESEDWDKAIAYFKEALRYDPSDSTIQENLLQAQHDHTFARQQDAIDRKDWNSAIHYAQELGRFNPKSTKAGRASIVNKIQAMAARDKGDWDSALHYDQESVRLLPVSRSWMQATIFCDQGHVAEAKGDWNSAIHYYQEALQAKGYAEDRPFYKKCLARAQAAAAGESKKVETQSGGAARVSAPGDDSTGSPNKKSPENPVASRRLPSGSNTNAGQTRASTPKEEAELRMQLALTLAKKGDQKGSVKELNEALKLDPNSPRQKEVYAAWKESSSGGTSNHAPANQSTSARAPADQLDADKRAPELHDFPVKKFEKGPQLPLPPILKGEPPNKVVKNELEKYMKTWKARNQEYQKATPEKAAQLKTDMEDDNKKFKEKMKKSYGVDL